MQLYNQVLKKRCVLFRLSNTDTNSTCSYTYELETSSGTDAMDRGIYQLNSYYFSIYGNLVICLLFKIVKKMLKKHCDDPCLTKHI